MPTIIARPLLLVLLAVAIAAMSFWLGFREGAQVGIMVDSIPRGSISLAHLGKVQQGVSRNMVTAFEGDVDLALIWAYRLEQHPLAPALEPLWGLRVSEQSLTRLASYRKANPSPLGAQALAAEPVPDTPEAVAAHKDLLEGARQNERVISSMVAKYASQ